MKFPKVIQNKKTRAEVTIYGKSKGGGRKKNGSVTEPFLFYRVCRRVKDQRAQLPQVAAERLGQRFSFALMS